MHEIPRLRSMKSDSDLRIEGAFDAFGADFHMNQRGDHQSKNKAKSKMRPTIEFRHKLNRSKSNTRHRAIERS